MSNYPPGVTGNEAYFSGLTDEEEDILLYENETISTLRLNKPVTRLYIRIVGDNDDMLHHDVFYDDRMNTVTVFVGKPSGHILKD